MAELRRNRDLIGGIVLAFFLLFSLAPAGIMPVSTPEGVKVVICTVTLLTLALGTLGRKPINGVHMGAMT
ncbi:hypothetical protein [Martelella soudanensis]|uniref:hypothetical protein n=1 Tax=unclassified Martelella TaxID=2629616 RepID=UPI0015DE3C6C|nr:MULTISPECIES: hypothetical protein [unclassified Martelella]